MLDRHVQVWAGSFLRTDSRPSSGTVENGRRQAELRIPYGTCSVGNVRDGWRQEEKQAVGTKDVEDESGH